MDLVDLSSHWMTSRDQLEGTSGPNLLLGLARWTILHPLVASKDRSSEEDSTYAQLHLAILETLAESKSTHSVPVKSVVLLVSRVDEALKIHEDQSDLGSNKELSLDRLGQFLHCLSATKGIQGKQTELCNCIKKILNDNRLLQMYLNRYQ